MKDVTISDDGTYAVVSVNQDVYSLPTIYSAAYVFLDRAYIVLDKEGDKIVVYIKPKGNVDAQTLGMKFCNELVSYANYSSRVKDNNEITKTIVQRALLSADATLAQDIEDKEIEDLIKELEKEESKGAVVSSKEPKNEAKKK